MTLHPDALLLISGPTAVGKTDLALALAESLDGEIVNIDSVQMYRGLDIGSAKPSIEERSRVPHHLFDVWSPGEQGTVARYLEAATAVIADLRARKKTPIFVGGTGLYITALLHGLAELPKVDAELRAVLESRASADLRAELITRDPESAAAISANDRVRTIRALETAILSGRKASELRSAHGHKRTERAALILIPLLGRDHLYRRINERSVRMVGQGLVAEVRAIQGAFGADAPALDAIGYREVGALLRGELAESGLAEEIALNTRQFAKRQLTFWRNEPAKRGWAARPSGSDPVTSITGSSLSRRAQVKPIAALPWPLPRLTTEVRERLSQPLESSEVWFVAPGAPLAS